MAENNLGSVAVNSTVRFKFTTHAASGAAVAPSSAFENADLDVYKDGSATPRSSANGITMTSPFASTTGLHHVDIDLSDDTDSGFYATGSTYEVVLTPDETVDSLAVVKVVARFTIGATLDTIKTETAAILLDTGTTLDDLVDDLESRLGTPSDLGSGATIAANLVDIEAFVDILDDATSGNVKIAQDVAATLLDTGTDGVAIANGAITATKFGAGAIDAAAIAANAIGASELAADAVDEILDDTIGDGTTTVRQALRVLIAGMAGKLSGAATTTVTIRNLADSADVIVATVDADGNRSAVTVTP